MSVTGLYLHVAGRGACVGLGRPDDMFPDPADQAGVERARRVCGGCPVRAHCRTLARRLRVEHGVWGGVLHLPEPAEAADQPPKRSTPDGD
jgi:WhiB family redox-sensing transcriptional regulator